MKKLLFILVFIPVFVNAQYVTKPTSVGFYPLQTPKNVTFWADPTDSAHYLTHESKWFRIASGNSRLFKLKSDSTAAAGYTRRDRLASELNKKVDKTTTVNGQALSGNVSLALDDLSDVDAASPAVDDFLSWNGSSWIPKATTILSATGGVTLFPDSSVSGIGSYDNIYVYPSGGTEKIETADVITGGGEVLIDGYITEELNRTVLEGGVYTFNTFEKVSGTPGVTQMVIRVYKRTSGGTETELFNVTSAEINNETVDIEEILTTQGSFAVNETDRVIIKYYAKTTHSATITVSFYHNGSVNYSHVHVPWISKHNDLSGLNLGDYKHLTAAEFAIATQAATNTLSGYTNATTQTFGGIKTFTLSPIVPTPTTSTQAASKGYADGLITQTITNGVTATAPSEDAVYDALAAKPSYPGAGIALSTGSAWGTSITNNSANWNTAYGWGNHSGLYKGVADSTAASGFTRRDRLASQIATREPVFSKNTGFNKNFGSTTGTVLEGRTFGTAANNNTGDFAPTFTLTTTGTSGAATYAANVLNIPQYSGGGSSQWTTDTYGITYADNVGIGVASSTSVGLYVHKTLVGDIANFTNLSATGNGIVSTTAATNSSYSALAVYNGSGQLFRVRADGVIFANLISNTTKPYVLGYDAATKEITYFTTPPSGTVTSVTAGDGMTQTGTSTINPTLNVVSHAGTAGTIGTVNIVADAIGVNLGSTSTTAMRGDNGTTAYNDKINSLAFTGTTTKTLTLTQQDAGTVSNTFTDDNTLTSLSEGTRTSTTYGITSDGSANDILLPLATGTYTGLTLNNYTTAEKTSLAGLITPKYITQIADATLTGEQALSTLSTGLMKVTTGTGVITSVSEGSYIQNQNAAAQTANMWINGTVKTDAGLDLNPVISPTSGSVALVTSTGSINAGLHYYYVTYTTATGETNSNLLGSIITDGTHARATVTIPVSTDARVTGRKIYRTKAGGASTSTYLLTTVANNTATTYADNIADASLTGTVSAGYYQINTTGTGITQNGGRVALMDTYGTFFGIGTGTSVSGGGFNSLFGRYSGGNITTAYNVTAIGSSAADLLSTGFNSVHVGKSSGSVVTTGYNNVFVGTNTGLSMSGGSQGNTLIGTFAFNTGTPGTYSYNTAVGISAGANNIGSSSVFLGTQAGYYETGSSKLFIDNQARSSEAVGRTNALIYGIFHSTTAGQELRFNARVGIGITPTSRLTLPAGTASSGTAPLKFTSGTSLSTGETGAMEYDGTNLYFTPTGTTRKIIAYAGSNVQALSGTAPSWVGTSGLNATLTLTGNTTITLSALIAGQTGNIRVTNAASTYTLTFAGYTIEISPYVWSTADRVLTSGSSLTDCFSWYYDGSKVLINGTLGYK